MKNVLIEQKNIKLLNKHNVVENNTEIVQHILKIQ
jgi:hypothetical protein